MRSHTRNFRLDDLTEIRKEAPLKRLRNMSEPNKRPVTGLKSTEGLRLTEAGILVFELNGTRSEQATSREGITRMLSWP
jgi:hypothetical protein